MDYLSLLVPSVDSQCKGYSWTEYLSLLVPSVECARVTHGWNISISQSSNWVTHGRNMWVREGFKKKKKVIIITFGGEGRGSARVIYHFFFGLKMIFKQF